VNAYNAGTDAAMHYQRTTALVGDAVATLDRLIEEVRRQSPAGPGRRGRRRPSVWLAACQAKNANGRVQVLRYGCPNLYDDVWRAHVLSQRRPSRS